MKKRHLLIGVIGIIVGLLYLSSSILPSGVERLILWQNHRKHTSIVGVEYVECLEEILESPNGIRNTRQIRTRHGRPASSGSSTKFPRHISRQIQSSADAQKLLGPLYNVPHDKPFNPANHPTIKLVSSKPCRSEKIVIRCIEEVIQVPSGTQTTRITHLENGRVVGSNYSVIGFTEQDEQYMFNLGTQPFYAEKENPFQPISSNPCDSSSQSVSFWENGGSSLHY